MSTSSASGHGLLSDLWRSLGMELAIFGVTFVIALVIHFVGGKKKPSYRHGSGKVSKIAPPRTPPMSRSTCGKARSESPPKVAATVNACIQAPVEHKHTDRMIPRAELAGGGFRQPRSAAPKMSPVVHVINDVVDGMRSQQSPQQSAKFASRAVAAYEELRSSCGGNGPFILEGSRRARHSAVEFFTTLVQCAVRAGKPHLVQALIDDMVQEGVARSLGFYESALKQLAGQKHFGHALAVYDRLAADGLEPSAITCSCLISFAAEAGQYQRAINFYEKLSKITTPSIRAYMTVLRVHAKQRDWLASVRVLHEMRERRVEPDALVLNFVLATGIAADQVEDAEELLLAFDNRKRPLADVVSYNTLVKGYAQRGDADGALRAMGRMRARGLAPNAITFNTAMDSAIRASKTCAAWGLLEELRSSGLRPDKFTCSILVKGLSKQPTQTQIRSALDLLHEVDETCDSPLRSTLYHSVLEAAAQVSGDLAAEALATMRRHNVAPTAASQKLVLQTLPSK